MDEGEEGGKGEQKKEGTKEERKRKGTGGRREGMEGTKAVSPVS